MLSLRSKKPRPKRSSTKGWRTQVRSSYRLALVGSRGLTWALQISIVQFPTLFLLGTGCPFSVVALICADLKCLRVMTVPP